MPILAYLCGSGSPYVRGGVVVVGCVALLTALSVMRRERARKYPSDLVRHVTDNVRQAAQLGVATEQDTDPLLALLHATTALAHVRIARSIIGDQDIRKDVGCNAEELEFVLTDAQAAVMQRLAALGVEVRSTTGLGPATGWLGATR